MGKSFKKSWQTEVGLNYAPAYQPSGKPFCSGAINCSTGSTNKPAQVVEFPYVTRWISIINKDDNNYLRVGFSQHGVNTNNYFTIPKLDGSPGQLGHTAPLPLKVSEIWISGSTNVDIVAGLTTVPARRTLTATGSSWSGSIGVG